MREFCTYGSVGALGSNPQGHPARLRSVGIVDDLFLRRGLPQAGRRQGNHVLLAEGIVMVRGGIAHGVDRLHQFSARIVEAAGSGPAVVARGGQRSDDGGHLAYGIILERRAVAQGVGRGSQVPGRIVGCISSSIVAATVVARRMPSTAVLPCPHGVAKVKRELGAHSVPLGCAAHRWTLRVFHHTSKQPASRHSHRNKSSLALVMLPHNLADVPL